jgi:ABC-2 type transport system permease protein
LLWVILSTSVISFVTAKFTGEKTEQEKIEQMARVNSGMPQANESSGIQQSPMAANKLTLIMESIHFPIIIFSFIFYFLGGYLLYSALFAAVGSAVDSETDTQQFMLPVTIPLILGYIVSINVINNPTGAVAFWFSIIPFTSPIVMMVRIPFGVPYWQIGLSMGLLILGFLFTTWLAGKIYRTGILMYGKKVSYREIAKWIRYHN